MQVCPRKGRKVLKFGLRANYKLSLVVLLALLLNLWPLLILVKTASGAGDLPTGFEQIRFIEGLSKPTSMAFAPDGRLFVAEQGGPLRVVKGGQLLSKPFLDISGEVDATGERGLLGVAFDPKFSKNHYVYVYYTQKATGTAAPHNIVARFTAKGDVASTANEKTILQLPDLQASNHNGGSIHFGRDGKLYIAVGDNGRGDTAQSLDTLFGKVLRINKDGTIPKDNPFYVKASGNNRAIWAMGLRNPYTFATEPGTGQILINDVGQDAWEEIDKGKAGANYGWPLYEGFGNNPSYEDPVFAYGHGSTETTGCAITGGAFYDPKADTSASFPAEYKGEYFFADFCSGWIRRLNPQTGVVEGSKASSQEQPVDLRVRPSGDLYFLARATGSVEKIQYTAPSSS
jgi:glucose/arabinose dehydrogenase